VSDIIDRDCTADVRCDKSLFDVVLMQWTRTKRAEFRSSRSLKEDFRKAGRVYNPAQTRYTHLMAIPAEIRDKKYISLATYRKNGAAVRTPIWFAESDDKLVFMTRNDMWKYKRIRNNPQVLVAPCTIRGKISGPDFKGTARVLPPADWDRARTAIRRKYWLARLPFWNKKNEYLEIEISA
jgi:uncharacterized protein